MGGGEEKAEGDGVECDDPHGGIVGERLGGVKGFDGQKWDEEKCSGFVSLRVRGPWKGQNVPGTSPPTNPINPVHAFCTPSLSAPATFLHKIL